MGRIWQIQESEDARFHEYDYPYHPWDVLHIHLHLILTVIDWLLVNVVVNITIDGWILWVMIP